MRSLLALPELLGAERLAAFWPSMGEPDILPALRQIQAAGAAIFLPAVVGDSLVFRAATALDPAALPAGRFGIPAPTGGAMVAPEDLDVVLVPGLAFDRNGNRLGRGRGFYDRALATLAGRPPPPLLLGVCFAFQIVSDALPRAPHDIPVHRVVSDREGLDSPGAQAVHEPVL